VAIEASSVHIELGPVGTGFAVAVPVAVFLLSLWALHVRARDPALRRFGAPAVAALVLATPFTGVPVVAIGLLLVAYVGLKVVARLRAAEEILT
jgi:hypothetical protein